MSSLHIGCHLSISKGFLSAAQTAKELGADTFQFFTRNPRGGESKALDYTDISAFSDFINQEHFTTLLAHAPYTINMAAWDERVLTGAKELATVDMALLSLLAPSFYNVHPGSHKNLTQEEAFERIRQTMDISMAHSDGIFFLLETMSGRKNEMGHTFEQLREIIERAAKKDFVGITLDTCHAFCAGYDIVGDIDGVLTRFDKVIGLSRLKAIHLNDSANPFDSRNDRHAALGKGFIGQEAFLRIINHPALRKLPFILETPNDLSGYEAEILFLRDNYK